MGRCNLARKCGRRRQQVYKVMITDPHGALFSLVITDPHGWHSPTFCCLAMTQ